MSIIVFNSLNIAKWLFYMDKYNKRVFFLYNGRNIPYTILLEDNILIGEYCKDEEGTFIYLNDETLNMFFTINKHLQLQEFQKEYINDLLNKVGFKRGLF